MLDLILAAAMAVSTEAVSTEVEPAEALDWTDFYVAEAGAAAALAGLVVVAISINVGEILKEPRLVLRAAQSVALLVNILLIATFGLIPGVDEVVFGCLVLLTSAVNWIAAIRIQFKQGLDPDRRRTSLQTYALWHVTLLPLLIGAVFLIAGNNGGTYWIAAGIAASFVLGIVSAWVLLIEILR